MSVLPIHFSPEHERECLEHMSANGISFDGHLKSDGQLHRFSRDSKKSQPDEWYVCYEGVSLKGNPYLVCCYGTWSGAQEKFVYRSYEKGGHFSSEELTEIKEREEKRKQELETKMDQERSERVSQAVEKWERVLTKPISERQLSYLKRKQIGAYGTKYGYDEYGNAIVAVPIRNIDGELQAVQHIYEDGNKRIYGLKRGNFHILGSIEESNQVYVAEGYATGASIHEALKCPVVVAFDCGNLKPVVGNLREKYPKIKLIIAGDNDTKTSGNPGKTKAEEAAREHSCDVVVPVFPDGVLSLEDLTDFNDLHVHCGLEEVQRQLSLKPTRLQALNIDDLLTMDIRPKKLIMAPWLPEKGLTMIYAERGVGKTYLTLTVAYAIACGKAVLRWEVLEPRKVLYIDGEMPGIALQERLRSISKSFKCSPPDPSYFRIFSQDFQPDGIRDLGTLLGQQAVNDLIADTDVIILDNLSTLIRSGKENEAESWLPVQEWALALRRQGKSVIFIHHAGKNGTSRGTSKREDVLDSVLKLKRPSNYTPKDGARFEIHFEKSRGFYGEDADPFEVTLNIAADGVLSWKCDKVEGYELETIVALYKDGMTNQRELSKETDISLGKVNKLLKEARECGMLE